MEGLRKQSLATEMKIKHKKNDFLKHLHILELFY